jgi:hypothetical protein
MTDAFCSNLWAPNRQTEIVDVLSDHYDLSQRFRAILKSKPENVKPSEFVNRTQPERRRPRATAKHDVELGNGSANRAPVSPEETNHYSIASHLINYQSLDLGEKFICIGSNWIYHPARAIEGGGKPEKIQKRLWSWLFLCDDSTVVSIHEDPLKDGNLDIDDTTYMQAIRGHAISVLRQLSSRGIMQAGSVGMTSVRLLLRHNGSQMDPGFEGSSNLFYYLFDYWLEGYRLLISVQERLDALVSTQGKCGFIN